MNIILLAFSFSACSSGYHGAIKKCCKEQTIADTVVTFYALGDWGTADSNQHIVAQLLRQEISGLDSNELNRVVPPFVLGLGDNIYPNGLPKNPWGDEMVEKILKRTFGDVYDSIEYKNEKVMFHIVAGNHDHAEKFRLDPDWGDVIHQETTAESLFTNYKYYPMKTGRVKDTNDFSEFEGLKLENLNLITQPEKIAIKGDTNLISIFALDTQILLKLYNFNYDSTLKKHWDQLEDLLRTDNSTWKIVIGHHPIKTYGWHGGKSGLMQWLWAGPRNNLPWWLRFIPIFPIIASTIDKFHKGVQDTDNKFNMKFQNDLLRILKKHKVIIYLSGHDHNQQFINLNLQNANVSQLFQVVSGSSAKSEPVSKNKKDLIFADKSLGFTRFDLTKDEIWIEFFGLNLENGSLKSLKKFKITKNDFFEIETK